MSLFSLLVAAALSVSAQEPKTEDQLRSEAKAYVAAVCQEKPAACPKTLVDDYDAVLKLLKTYEGGDGIEQGMRKALKARLGALDKTAGALPKPKDLPDNGALAFGALARRRLAALKLKLKPGELPPDEEDEETPAPAPAPAAPKADSKPLPSGKSETQAAQVVEALCAEKHKDCAAMKAVLDEAGKLDSPVAACETTPCEFAKIDPLMVRAHQNMRASLKHPEHPKLYTLSIFVVANNMDLRVTKVLAKFVETAVANLTSETDAFEKQVDAAEKSEAAEVKSLPKKGSQVLVKYQDAALASDRLTHMLGYSVAGKTRDQVNTQTTRLAGLRGRALAVITARGLKLDPNTDDGFAVGAGASGGAPADAKAKLAAAGVALSQPKATLLDSRSVPFTSSVAPPDIVKGSPSRTELLIAQFRGDELAKADAKRRLGKTTTIGAPGRYASLVYDQGPGGTCAIASEAQILKAHGLLGPGDMQVHEAALVKEATEKGWFDGGTIPEYMPALLTSRGLLATNHVQASWADLEAALRRGSTLLVSVDARRLWASAAKDPKRLGHAILVTGGEIETKNNELLGVYINDTGASPSTGGRFLPASQMKAAYSGSFLEVR